MPQGEDLPTPTDPPDVRVATQGRREDGVGAIDGGVVGRIVERLLRLLEQRLHAWVLVYPVTLLLDSGV